MNINRPKVVVIGSSNTDLVVRSSRLPRPGETVMASAFNTVQGGKGANQAVAAARLGAQVTFIARVGNDAFGQAALAAFEADGIDTQYVTIDPDQPTGIAVIGVDDTTGENSISVVAGANGALCVADVERATDAIVSADVVICQLETPLVAAVAGLTIAHGARVPTILNPSPFQPLSDDVLALVSVLLPNEGEAAQLAGRSIPTDEVETGRALLDRGAKSVLITLGKRGSLLVDESGTAPFPAYTMPKVVDTTGAGDCFAGALAVGIAEKKSVPVAISFAAAAAAISVTRAGAQPSLPYREEVEELVATT